MSEHKITATSRKDEGKGASRRLRRAGQVPAIVYGGRAEPISIQLEHERTWLLSQQEWFYSSILDLEVDGKAQKLAAEGLLAVCIQHEIDHLDGIVFVDHLSQLKQGRIKSKLAKQARVTA